MKLELASFWVLPSLQEMNDTESDNSIPNKIAPCVSSVVLSTFSGVEAQKTAVVGQMWICGYTDPVQVWNWWRITGYPTIKHIESQADWPTDSLPYWMEPHANDDMVTVLEFPCQSGLPQLEAANNANYNAARDALLKIANYGTMYNETTGRIFWDAQGL